jgi:hypothetical protein
MAKERINMAIKAQPATIFPNSNVKGKLMIKKASRVILNQFGLVPKKLLNIVFNILLIAPEIRELLKAGNK